MRGSGKRNTNRRFAIKSSISQFPHSGEMTAEARFPGGRRQDILVPV
jgi:hypothetical protein